MICVTFYILKHDFINNYTIIFAQACGVPVSRGSGGTTLVATINIIIFFHSPPPIFSPLQPFFIEVDWSAQKSRGRHLSRPRWPFWSLLLAILDYAGVAALQAVSEWPWRR